jgi:hypothetical protein
MWSGIKSEAKFRLFCKLLYAEDYHLANSSVYERQWQTGGGVLSYAIGGRSLGSRGTNTFIDGTKERWKSNIAILKVAI